MENSLVIIDGLTWEIHHRERGYTRAGDARVTSLTNRDNLNSYY